MSCGLRIKIEQLFHQERYVLARNDRMETPKCSSSRNDTFGRDLTRSITWPAAYSESIRRDEMCKCQLPKDCTSESIHSLMPASPVFIS